MHYIYGLMLSLNIPVLFHVNANEFGLKYLKDRFNYEYLILRFGYPAHFAGTNNCGIAKTTDHTH